MGWMDVQVFRQCQFLNVCVDANQVSFDMHELNLGDTPLPLDAWSAAQQQPSIYKSNGWCQAHVLHAPKAVICVVRGYGCVWNYKSVW